MAKAQREWAEALAAQQPLAREDVAAFVSSIASSSSSAGGVADSGAAGALAAAAASLEAVVPLALFLSRSLGKFPDAVVPQIVAALETVVSSAEALVADAGRAAAAAAAGTPSAAGALPPAKWAALLAQAMAELAAVLGLLPLHAEWKAQLSGAFRALLQQLLVLAARRQDQQGAMLAGFRSALTAGRQRLPLTSADAAQLFLHIAEQHLGLTSQPSAAPAGSWGREGDLPWALAGQLAPLALPSSQLGAEEASRVALGACAAIDAALKPVLQPDDSGSEPSVQGSPMHGSMHAALPTPAFVAAAAALAAQTARGLAERHSSNGGEGSSQAGLDKDAAAAANALSAVTDTLLGVCEDCTAAVAEIGVGDRASDALLNISLAVARQAAPLLALAGERDRNALQDLLPRMQAVMAGSARLAELEHFFPGGEQSTADAAAGGAGSGGGAGSYDAEAKVKALWVWDLSQDLAAATSDPTLRTKQAWKLTRALAEGTAMLLSAAWQQHPADLTTIFVPLAGTVLERVEALPVLGRMLALSGGDEELARLVLPLLRDTLASQTTGAEAEAYAVAAHTLASMAICCAVHDRRWGYDQVVDLLIKLYKFPNFSISRALLHGTGATPGSPRPAGTPPPPPPAAASVAAGAAPREGPDVPIAGRCPGALADALLRLAEGVRMARLVLVKDLRTRLLTLFADFALILPNDSYIKDLGALLPAVGAVAEAVGIASSGRMSASLSVADMSLDALNTAQEEDLLVLRLFRQLWLYCGVYDFGSLQQAAPAPQNGRRVTASHAPTSAAAGRWPPAWHGALGRVAAATPLLILGWEQFKPDELMENLASEFGSRLTKLGPAGESAALAAALAAELGTDPWQQGPVPAPLAAHLLTQATKSLCRARFSSYESCAQEGVVPLNAPLHHLRLSIPGSLGYAWQQLIAEKVFAIFTARLDADRVRFTAAADLDALDACAQQLAQVLVGYLVQQGTNGEVPRLADRMLAQLLDRFPALQYKRDVLAAMFHATDEEEAAQQIEGPRPKLAYAWLARLVRRACEEAPGPTEAMLAEQMNRAAPGLPAGGAEATMEVMGRYMAEVLQLVRVGRARFPMAALQSGMMHGIIAWSTKLHFLGRVAGLAESAEAEDLPGSSVPLDCGRMLSAALRRRHTDRAVAENYLQATAALVQYPTAGVSRELRRLLCWVPVKRFTSAMMRVAVVAWHWVLAAGSPEVQLALLSEIADAWAYTVRARMGMFAPFDAAHAAQHSSGIGSAPAAGPAGSGEEATTGGAAGSNGEEQHVDAAAAADAIHAHHLWIVFLWEVSEQRRHDLSSMKGEVVDLSWRLFSASLADAGRCLTAHPASTGARFRLLHLALKHCRAQQAQAAARGKPCPLPILLLFEQVLAAALQWFELPQAWHYAEQDLLREALGAVRDFAAAVQAAPLPQLPRDLPPPHPVWGEVLPPSSNAARQALLQLLLSAEVERLAAWADPLEAAGIPPSAAASLTPAQWAQHVRTAWAEVSPALAVALSRRFPGAAAIRAELQKLVAQGAGDPAVQNLPEAATLLATPAAAKANAPQLQHLAVWAPLPLLEAIELAAGPAGRNPAVLGFVMRSLQACRPEEVAFFLPQLVQLLRDDPGGTVERFLLDAASHSVYFAHMLVCQLLSEGTPPDEAFNPTVKRSNWSPPADTGLWGIADRMRQRVLGELHGPVMERLQAELSFFDEVTAMSGKLYPVPKDERKAAAVKLLEGITVPRDDLYIPTNPDCRVLEVIPESAAPMQSAAKCPILAAFRCEQSDELGAHEKVQACIFKVGDDCRQDVLALQVMRLLKGAFDAAGLPLYLAPYGVVPTGHEQGIIEVIPHAKSRAQLGEMFDGGLFEIFQHEFGMPGARRFEAARQHFLESTAAYSVATYILWAKDRHNGNLMLDNLGRFLHIDFGYILGISPGGNLGFETAPFKLSYEMTQLLDPGATRASPTFRRFMELTCRGFLAARSVADSVVAAVAMMAPSQLPCFGYGKPLEALRSRFKLELSDAQAADYMKGLILGAYDRFTTGAYDYIQHVQQGIPK
ncbi:hypothetical protein ABPG75_007869 [Micractinium tetrahymenae]